MDQKKLISTINENTLLVNEEICGDDNFGSIVQQVSLSNYVLLLIDPINSYFEFMHIKV
jgi:hypothetical protein